MKTEAAYVLLALSATGALSAFSGAPINSVKPPIELPEATPIAATAPPLDIPVGEIALDTSSGSSASGATRSDTHLTRTLATYLLLHRSWNESPSTATAPALSVCSE